MSYVGTEVVALNSRRLVAGRGRYAADIYFDHMLFLAFARSIHAHATIRSINSDAARKLPGVVMVLTGEDLKKSMGPLVPTLPHGGSQSRKTFIYGLAVGKVRYVGEPVAVVAAEDRYSARKTADLVEIEYEELPAVVDCEAALAPDAPKVQDGWEDNVMGQLEHSAGDVEKSFRDADGVVSGVLKSHRYLGTPMEPRAYVANFDPFRETLTMWASTQNAHLLRAALAETFHMPETKIHVTQSDVGGAFGLKIPFFADEAVVAYLALELKRPVKWVEERVESFLAGGHAREERFHYEAAYKNDGRVVGLRVRFLADVGVPTTLHGWAMAFVGASVIPTAYKIPNCSIAMQAVTTNKCPWTAYRGFGKENANFLMERVMDRVADATGLDRAAVRLRNYVLPEEFPYPQVSGSILDSGNYPAALGKLLEMVGYSDFPRLQDDARRLGRRIGIGISHELMGEGGTRPGTFVSGYDGCTVRVTPSGEVEVLTGVTSPGSGNETAIAQIVADAMGAELKRVSVVQGDTAVCPFGLGNYSSRSVLIGGAAANEAALEIRGKMFKVAARMLEVMPADLASSDGRIRVRDAPLRSVSFEEVTGEVYKNSYGPYALDQEPGLEATRYFRHANVYHQPELHPFRPALSLYPSWPDGVAACVVEVDPETGTIKILRYCSIHDSGKIINPLLAEGNLHGGIAQGIGGAVYERLAYDDHGQLNTVTFYDYTIPTAVELPTFELAHQETPAPFNPLGCKGVGESGVGTPLNAIMSAVENAFSDLKLELDETPLTPSRLWKKLQQARKVTQLFDFEGI